MTAASGCGDSEGGSGNDARWQRWTLGFVKNSVHNGDYQDFGSSYVDVDTLETAPDTASDDSFTEPVAGSVDLRRRLGLVTTSPGSGYIHYGMPGGGKRSGFAEPPE